MNRNRTWIDLKVTAPTIGTVFIHSSKPDRRMTVTSIVDDQIIRTDSSGESVVWGDLNDWFDEVRRRTIEIVQEPH